MARAGLCSRRDAETWIAAGRVSVNGATLTSPGVNITSRDRITIDGKPIPKRERTRLFRYYKPVGLVSSHADPHGRQTLFDALPGDLPRLISVGRLDIGTEGLLLLTNDGALARVLELPQTQWLRKYRVRAHGRVTQAELDALRHGITIEGVNYGPIEATLEREQGANVWLSFAIREGKNREVKNVLAHLGLLVNRLIRVSFGPFELDRLAEGAIEEVETKVLREQLGARIVDQAGCDFAAPLIVRAAKSGREPPRIARGPRSDQRHGGSVPDGRPRPGLRKQEEEKPPGRPRRGHAWRADDAPLRRTYRGSRREDLKIAKEGEKRAGVLKDRKGRRIFVERFDSGKPRAEARENSAPPQRPSRSPRSPRRPSRDRSSGPRPSRPQPSGPRPPRDR
jgi:23S rRNA pseudouridine2605 synthase